MLTELQVEFETYLAQKPELLRLGEHQYVLIKATEVEGIYQNFESALKRGYERFGFSAFFIRKIEAVEVPVYYHSSYIS